MLVMERLGGADYDGDMIKTISDPILNACVRRNYNLYRYEKHKSLTNTENIPLLMIPTAQPQIRNADDWEARFETVRSTFSSRVGQICNAALDRSIIAYNENSDAEERERCREETETLAILTGLEIDSAKSGIRPDLDEYLTHKTVKRSDFLKYKTLVEEMETRRAWYEPTHAARVKAFFKRVDWGKVDSNVERLPYLAQQLKKNTPRIKAKPAKDEELFSFAAQRGLEERLDSDKLAAVDALFAGSRRLPLPHPGLPRSVEGEKAEERCGAHSVCQGTGGCIRSRRAVRSVRQSAAGKGVCPAACHSGAGLAPHGRGCTGALPAGMADGAGV